MKTSVILSTYNQPEWLRLTLCGYAAQTTPPDEVIIADDGSDDRTERVIEEVRRQAALDVQRVRHPDEGFRKCVILNRALEAATGDYLIFTDGDCVPRRDFVAAHLRDAAPGRFVSGGAVRLSLAASRRIAPDDIASGRCFSPTWLRERWTDETPAPPARLLKLHPRGLAAAALNRLTPTRATWNGGNASCWRADALAVGGFDERMQYGGEDREFGERLDHLGRRPVQARYTAVCLHLEHGRGYVADDMAARNAAIRTATRRDRIVRTEHGLARSA